MPGTVACAFNPSPREAEVGRYLSRPTGTREILSTNKNYKLQNKQTDKNPIKIRSGG